MKRNLVIIILVIFIITGGYFIYKNFQVSDESGDNSLVDKITVANIGEYTILNLIAEDQGYFQDNGLDVQINEYPSGPAAIDALLKGDVDFAIAADFVCVSNISTNKDLRIISGVSSGDAFKFLGRKDKGITQSADLNGKRIGVTRKGLGEFFLGQLLTLNGLYFHDVTIVDLQPDEIVIDLEKGKIDAAVVFNPYAYNIQDILRENILVSSAQGSQRAFTVALSTDTFINSQPDTVRRYLNALYQSEELLKRDEHRGKIILAKAMEYDFAYVNYIWPELEFGLGLDQSLLLNMESEERFRIENELTTETKVPNYLEYIYFDALEEVNPDRISIIR
ncbi:MAG TPA: NrtA/SsuA/CpmA family ABC transporter substrate-binding protein [Candidatus Dojkabacteria bacterium]|jgi:NitT/TauT family transport system substrate-binding protein